MITTVDLPQVGESVTEGVIGKWLVSPGQWVDRYDPIVEVVTDKVSMEIPSPFAGVFIKALVEEGEVVPMGSPICEIEDQNAITQDDEKTPPSKFELMDINNTYSNLYKKERISRPFLNKFERTKILGVRTEQLASGAKPLIDIKDEKLSAFEIALKEFNEKKIPFIIRRHLPNDTYEDWKLKELIY